MSLTFLQRKPNSGLGNIRSSPSDPSRNVDWVLMITQAALMAIGCAVIYSASRTKQSDPYLYVTRQVIFVIAAVVVLIVVMSIDYEWLRERARFFYGVTLMILVLVIIAGTVSGGARLSFDLGPINIQPAEFAKVTVLLALASYLTEDRVDDEVSYAKFLGGLIMVGIPSALVIIQPDLGSASVLVAMAMGVLLVGGAKPRYIALISFMSVATVAAAFISGIVSSYQIVRIRVFFNQDATSAELRDFVYQPRNAMRAIATGGLTGKGWLQGPITNTKDIPVQWADFPFSAVGEQFGLIGCGVLLGLFAIMLVRIWRIAHLSKDMLGTYLCAGAFTMLLWQVFQNVAMTIGVMPVTGLPLPFISYGGSGLLSFCALLGLVQNVHMRRYR